MSAPNAAASTEPPPNAGPRFSVIIPTYNRSGMLGETLQSVFAQEFTDYEIIVVDDGSTDDTLASLAELGDRVRVFQQQHKGCAAARNLGAREARGEYLAFLDDDDSWLPWSLAVYNQGIESQGKPAFVAGKLSGFDDTAEIAAIERLPSEIHGARDLYTGAIQHGYAQGVAHGVVRRDAYLKVGGCEERNVNGTDSDVLLKVGAEPGFAIIKQPVTLAYRLHTGSTTRNYDKGLAGVRLLFEHERDGTYPGGPQRRRERWANVLLRTRGVSYGAAKRGRPDVAWTIYAETFLWNLRLGRGRYLLGMPPLIAKSWLMRLLGR